MLGVQALWTAAHYRIPMLIVVANNRSFFNDEIHQHQVAVRRDRPTENRWIGLRIDDPAPDLAGLARAQGLLAHGPVTELADLDDTLALAVEQVRMGNAVVIDVHVASAIHAHDIGVVGDTARR